MKTTAMFPASAALGVIAIFALPGRAATYHSDPVAGRAAGDGSADAPWPALRDLVASGKLGKLQGGDTLLLRGGNHGDVRISGENAEFITIAGAPGESPQLSRLEISSGSKWRVKGLTITPSIASTPYKGSIVTLAEKGAGTDIVLEDCFLYTELDSTRWTAGQWMKAQNGIFSGRHGVNLTIRNNYVMNTRFGISLCSPDSLCEGNVVANFSGDGIRITRDKITVQYNVVKNCFVGAADGDPNHDDLMQCFLFNKGTGTLREQTIRGNILIGYEDAGQPLRHDPQAIGFFDGPLVDFLVEKNVIMTNHYHGISLYDAVNCRILDNAVRAISEQKMRPWIMLGTKNKGGASGNTVKNNMARSFNLKADPTVVAENNIPVNLPAFDIRLKQQSDEINRKFGEFHPVAKFPRVGKKPVDSK